MIKRQDFGELKAILTTFCTFVLAQLLQVTALHELVKGQDRWI